MKEGDAEMLKLTENAQPALMATGIAVVRVIEELTGKPLSKIVSHAAGHSLGEYTSLVSAGSLTIFEAARLLKIRGMAMQNAVPVGKGMMLAVMGTNLPQLEQFINNRKNKDGVCEIANDNSDGQIIISGDKNSILLFQNELKENKIKTIPLNVSAPFHCSLMKPASEIMFEKIKNTNFKILIKKS